MSRIITFFALFLVVFTNAQEPEEEKENLKALNASTDLTWEGNKALSNEQFVEAEINYRKAISKSDQNVAAPYNLGNAYYNEETYGEAFGRFKKAGELATDKKSKHQAYHNMGNVFMKRKEYEKAVEAYKEALRNNPTDDETRYNLALAKEMLKKEQDEHKNDQNEDNKDQEDKKDQDQNEDKKDGDDGENEKDDQEKEGDKGEDEKDEDKDGEGDQKDQDQKKPEEGDQKEKPQQPRPNQLSKQQIHNLLDAMQKEEKKVQEKIDAQKVKGAKVKNEKDW